MSILTVILIAVGLAMDALTVATGLSLKFRWNSKRQFFRLSFHFGFFQFMMPVLGWYAGESLGGIVSGFGHWIAFLLLTFLGIKLFRDTGSEPEGIDRITDPTKGLWLVMLSLATSIDAFAVGISLSAIGVSIWMPCIIIGIVAALFTLVGMYFGNRIRGKACGYLSKAGGVVLIGIGLKILIEHLLHN